MRVLMRGAFDHMPVLLLVAVALSQIVLASTQELLSWKGGGFGMFATVDGVELRDVRALTREGARIETPAEIFREERRARILPTAHNLEAFGAALARERAGAEVSEGTEVYAIEVWRAHFSGDRLRPDAERIARVVVAGE